MQKLFSYNKLNKENNSFLILKKSKILMFLLFIAMLLGFFLQEERFLNNQKLLIANDISEVKVKLDDELLNLETTKAIIKEGRVMIPARVLAENWGIMLAFNPQTGDIRLNYLENQLEFNINSQDTLLNGQKLSIETPPIIVEGRLMLPLRLVSEAFEAKVIWEEHNKTVYINTPRDFIIKDLKKAKGIYQSGDKIVSQLFLQNRLNEEQELWVGYSLKDPLGSYYDVLAKPITLASKTGTKVEMEFEVPKNKELISGEYGLYLAVWDAKPGATNPLARRLAHFESQGEVIIFHKIENFSHLDESTWKMSKHSIGRGDFLVENVQVKNNLLRINLPMENLSSGEIQSQELLSYGRYETRLKTAEVNSHITGFFLYRAPDFMQEIDIEILRGKSNKIYFVLYAEGSKTKEMVKELDFDPAKNFHIYTIDYYPEYVYFYVDGEKIASFYEGIPQEKMYLILNAWYPDWIKGQREAGGGVLEVDWIRY